MGTEHRSDEGSQVVVPPSFVALFLAPGGGRPTVSRAELAERHDFCEDLAQALAETAARHGWELGITRDDALERVQRGLAQLDAGLSDAERGWIGQRLAELLP